MDKLKKLSWESILESYAKFRDRGKCRRQIEQTATTFRFTGPTAVSQLHDISISIGQLDIDKKKLVESYTPTAIAVDAYQYTLCNTLKDPILTKRMSPDRLTQHTENFIAAQHALAIYIAAFEAFIRDPEGKRENFDEAFDLLLDCFRNIVNQAQTLNAEQERKRAISRILSSVGIEEKDQEHTSLYAVVERSRNKLWKLDNIEDQIREENRNLHARLVQLITRRNLNSKLSSDAAGGASDDDNSSRIDGSSIFEMVDLLIRNGVLTSVDDRPRGFIEEIRRIGDKVARGEKITPEEWGKSDYSLGVSWLHSRLDLIEDQERQQQ